MLTFLPLKQDNPFLVIFFFVARLLLNYFILWNLSFISLLTVYSAVAIRLQSGISNCCVLIPMRNPLGNYRWRVCFPLLRMWSWMAIWYGLGIRASFWKLRQVKLHDVFKEVLHFIFVLQLRRVNDALAFQVAKEVAQILDYFLGLLFRLGLLGYRLLVFVWFYKPTDLIQNLLFWIVPRFLSVSYLGLLLCRHGLWLTFFNNWRFLVLWRDLLRFVWRICRCLYLLNFTSVVILLEVVWSIAGNWDTIGRFTCWMLLHFHLNQRRTILRVEVLTWLGFLVQGNGSFSWSVRRPFALLDYRVY